LIVTVVVPTYNEAGNLLSLAEALLALPVPGLRLLVVDDGSPDGTGRVADAVVQMDADFSPPPADVPRLLERLSRCDVAVGSRYAEGGSVADEWGAGRRSLSRSANAYARTLLALKTRDATAGFKAWRRSALEAVDLDRIRSSGYLFQVEMAYACERLGLRVAEVPIRFEERRSGRSKMSLKVKLEAALGVAGVWRRHRRLRAVPRGATSP
jgi:dolichol-phosphate mannosyltransferase